MDPSAYMHQYGSNSGPPNQGHLPQVLHLKLAKKTYKFEIELYTAIIWIAGFLEYSGIWKRTSPE